MNKFWNFIKNEDTGETELYFDGPISSETWYGNELTPGLFKDELSKHPGNITVWLSSPGGDVFAASQIYTMLKNHKGKITVKIDSLAASAASVVAMAGDETYISPTGYLMIHNPSTIAFGNREDMEKTIKLLDEIKEGIVNAYEEKTGLSRAKLSHFMDEETWFNAKKAVQLGFVDGILFAEQHDTGAESDKDEEEDKDDKADGPDEGEGDQREDDPEKPDEEKEEEKSKTENRKRITTSFSYSPTKISASIAEKLKITNTVPIAQLEKRLSLLKNWR